METATEDDALALLDKPDKEAEKTAVGRGKRPRDHDDEEAEEYRERLAEKMAGRKF
jgi:uncharacterized phage protein gp47/JayE